MCEKFRIFLVGFVCDIPGIVVCFSHYVGTGHCSVIVGKMTDIYQA